MFRPFRNLITLVHRRLPIFSPRIRNLNYFSSEKDSKLHSEKEEVRELETLQQQLIVCLTAISQLQENQRKIFRFQRQWQTGAKAILIAATLAAWCYVLQILYGKQWEQYKMRKKYSKQELTSPDDFIQDTSVEKQLEPFIRKKDNQAVSFLVGAPGTGKTTAIKNIVTKLRNQGYEGERKIEAYYISLRSDTDQKYVDLEESARDLIKLMKAIAAKNVGKAVYLVVDHINQLEQIKDQNQRVQTENLIAILQAPNIHITVISSSSSYAIDSKNDSPIARRADFSSINLPATSETKQIIQNILKRFQNKFKNKNSSKIITEQQHRQVLEIARDYLSKVDPPIKQIQTWLRIYRYSELKSLNKYLQEQFQQFSLKQRIQIANLISEVGLGDKSVDNAKVVSRLFQLILNYPDQVSMEHYNKILNQFRYQTGFLSKVIKLMYKLQKQAFSIYGKPRHELYKKIFEEIRSIYKTE